MGLDEEDPGAGNGDPRSRFRLLYESTFRDIYAFVARTNATGGDTDDVVAEIYLAVWQRIHDVPDPPNDRLWLYGVARHTLARFERSRQRRRRLISRLSSEPSSTTAHIDPHSRNPEVLEAVSHLPKREREAVQLIYWVGLSQEEAAAVIGCSANALRIRLHRARQRLSRRLGIASTTDSFPIDLDLEAPK